jgi:hypothetical protein
MMKLTAEQKTALIEELSYPHGYVKLMCDGYEISLVVEPYKALSYVVMTYVNGFFEGKWMNSKQEFPEQKFMRKSIKSVYSARTKAKFEKIYGKREYKKKSADFDRKYVLYMPTFGTGKAAISHLVKVCESIEVMEK